jgi:cytochrome c-type biogenesis protein CcmH
MKKILLICLLCPFALYAVDKNTADMFTESQESHYKSLINELRCVVCQNQSLADSNAELAQDLRDKVSTMILQGKTDAEIIEFLVARYGDFVLYNPPLKRETYILWVAPLILLCFSLIMLAYFIRQHTKISAESDSLTQAEEEKIKQLLSK